jgi:D-3-phosphoglycerate dehydrogenase/C-terminal binding protein
VGRVEDADAIVVFHHVCITRRTIERLERCKVIARCGVGVDNVDGRSARQKGIDVTNVPDYGTEEVADSAIGMMLAMTRGIARMNLRMQSKLEPWIYEQDPPPRRLRGEVFGIVGLGRIGTATAMRAKSFGMDVIYYDPYREDGYDKALGVRRAESLTDLFDQSYVVSLHCPLTDETRHLVNADALQYFREGSYLVNTSRGSVVDTTAIPDVIASGRLAGAALDVLAQEPPAEDDPLLAAWRDPGHPAHDRVLITPHIAFYCIEGLSEMRVKAALCCRQALLGQPIRSVVN